MQVDQLFCLSGYGYLRDIFYQENKFIARMQLLIPHDASTLSKDDVWLDCEVTKPHLQSLLFELLTAVQSGRSVIVLFKAEYQAFLNAASGLTPEDPNYTITLRTKLNLIYKYVIESQSCTRIAKPFMRAMV